MPVEATAANESLPRRMFLLFFDKIVLGVLVGIAVLLATIYADHLKAAWSLQEKDRIFDERLAAYSEVVQLSDNVVEQAAVLLGAPRDPDNPLSYDPVTARVDALQNRWREISGGGSGGSWTTPEELTDALYKLVSARNRYALLLPDQAAKSLDGFIGAVAASLEQDLTQIERARQKKTVEAALPAQQAADQRNWANILETHARLGAELRATLGLDVSLANWRGLRP